MAAGETCSSCDERFIDDQDERDLCAPIQQTLTGELEGLFRFAMARLGHQAQVAEDVVQQALLIALAHASPPSQAHLQRAWLRGIVQNVIRRHLRSSRRGREALGRVALEQHGTEARSHDGAPQTADEGRVRAVYLALTGLDQADQDLFYAFYRAGRSHACIAAELGTTTKGVEARLYRLRSRLRTALDAAENVLP